MPRAELDRLPLQPKEKIVSTEVIYDKLYIVTNTGRIFLFGPNMMDDAWEVETASFGYDV
jgi:hypothetical protein